MLPFYQDLLGFKNAIADDSGAMLELQQAANPLTTKTPDEYLRHGRTGITELALDVPDIDGLFQRVKDAGYQTRTDYLWSMAASGMRSFLFYDPDGALIQAVEVASADQPA